MLATSMAIIGIMSGLFVVEFGPGPMWDTSRTRRDQNGWPEHAAFMDSLADSGFILFGGPVGEIDGDQALLVVASDSCDAVRAQLSYDPWYDGILTVEQVRPWTIWLGTMPDSSRDGRGVDPSQASE